MNFFKVGMVFLFTLTLSTVALAQPKIKEVKVIGIPLVDGQPKVPSYMIGTSEGSTEGSYDPRVIGFPGFNPGYVILANGEKLEGQIAVMGKPDDPLFVKRCALVVFDDDVEKAYYVGAAEGVTFCRQKKKNEDYFDNYDGGFVKRLVSGKANLYYNPYMGQNGKKSSFLPASVVDELREAAAKGTMKKSLEDGNSISQSMQTTMSNDEAIYTLASSIEIAEKEYLLSVNDQTILVLESNLEETVQNLFKECPIDAKDLKSMSKKFGKIEDTVIYYNENCGN